MYKFLKFISIALFYSSLVLSDYLMAAPFDKTGIIDLKNEGTTRGSCATVGTLLTTATNTIYLQIMQRPAKGQDDQWKNEQDAKEIRKFGDSGSFWSKQLKESWGKYVPPSQTNDYVSEYDRTYQRFDKAIKQDPWQGVYAWNYCGEIYGFLKK